MLDTFVSRELRSVAMINTDEPAWAERNGSEVGQLDLAPFGSSHGIIGNFHIQGRTSALIHTLITHTHTHTTSLPQVTSSGYYSVSSVNDSIFPRLITWSNTRVTKSSVRQQNTGVVIIIPLFPPANPIWTAYCVRTGVHPWLDLMETCNNMWARLRWCKVTSPWVALFSHISPLMLFNDPLPLLEDKEVRRKNTHGSHNRLW